MQSIGSWKDLEGYGIVVLTGEACGLSYRLLCDVTDAGKGVAEKCLGVGIAFAEPWNRGTDDAPHVGSIMFAPEMLVPLAAFALLEAGYPEVWQVGTALIGIEETDSPTERQIAETVYGKERSRIFQYGGTAGDRNVHQMSGRVR